MQPPGRISSKRARTARTAQARGPRGPRGPQGPQGPQGPPGPSGLAGLEVVSASSATADVASTAKTVMCPVGKIAIGGGGEISVGAGEVFIDGSVPALKAGKPVGWTVHASRLPTGTISWSKTTFAICVNDPTAATTVKKRNMKKRKQG